MRMDERRDVMLEADRLARTAQAMQSN